MNQRLALIIGNSEYQDAKLTQLVTPESDASILAEILRTPEIGGFDEVTTLINASESILRREIARFWGRGRRNDLLLLYFSGHGILDDQGLLHFATTDTENELLSATTVSAAFIRQEMDRSLSRSQVLILDCCNSGAFTRGAKGTLGNSVGTATTFEVSGYGRVVLTATDATQYAWEGGNVIGQAENSVFTHFLIQGLQTGAADLDGDGQITLDELYEYVYEKVLQATPKQKPLKFADRQQGQITIARTSSSLSKIPHPSGVFSLYTGLEKMREILQVSNDAKNSLKELFLEFVILEERLLRNLQDEEAYGRTENSRSEQAQVVYSLNKIAFKKLGISFVRLCKSDDFQTSLGDVFERIRGQIPIENEEAHVELAIYEFRLIRAILDEQKFGATLDVQADKRRILSVLNDFTNEKLGQKFPFSI